jgi:hypothetical protein
MDSDGKAAAFLRRGLPGVFVLLRRGALASPCGGLDMTYPPGQSIESIEGCASAWDFVGMLSLSNGMAAAASLTNVIDVTPTTLQHGRPKPHQ